MNELLLMVRDHLLGMWHRRWIGLGVAWLTAIIAVTVALRTPERYEASARVYVDTETLLRPLLAGLAIMPNLDQQVALISRTLISRPNVDKLVRMADLDLNVQSVAGREALIDQVNNTIRMGSAGNNLYVIAYRDPSPERAKKVVQSLLTIFVESSLGDKRQDTRTAVKFLDDQIVHYEQALQASEDRLKEFKLKYMGISSARDGQDYFGRVERLSADIENARLELQSAEQARDSYKKELSGEVPTLLPEDNTDAQSRNSSPELDARLATLRKELDELLRKYTDAHPDVMSTKRLIAQLEAQRKTDIETRAKGNSKSGAPASIDRNPVYQQIRVSLADAEANVASTRARLAALQGQYTQLRAQARMVPQIENEYTQLTRDYDLQKKTYDSLRARREAAGMGIDSQDSGGAQFRIIDPPRVMPDPVPPTRLWLLFLALGASVLAGLVASFIAAEVAPIVHDARGLRTLSKRPMLGMISMLPSEPILRLRRRNAYLFTGSACALLIAFIGVVTLAQLFGRSL